MAKLFFFGRFPADKEVGGITSFTYNFSNKYKDKELHVIDFYPAQGKCVPENVEWTQIEGNMAQRLARLFMFVFNNDGAYFFNFSSIRAVIFLLFIPKKKADKWFAIFHHGDQKKIFSHMSWLQKALVARGVKKLDSLGYLSEKQRQFYEGIFAGQQYKVSPFVPVESQIEITPKNELPSLLMSGFPTHIYRFIETIEILEKLWDEGFLFNLNLCIYGYDNDNLMNEIEKKVDGLDNISLHMFLDDEAFKKILHESALYIRLNTIDSFGLVVAEAVEAGVKVIATNVCERYPGAYLIEPDDFETLFVELKNYFQVGNFSTKLVIQDKAKDLIDYGVLIKELTK